MIDKENLFNMKPEPESNDLQLISEYSNQLKAFAEGKKLDWKTTNDFDKFVGHISYEYKGFPPIKLLEDILSYYKKKEFEIAAVKLPELMQRNGLSKLTLATGETVSIKEEINFESLSEMDQYKKDKLFGWIINNGGQDLLTDTVKLGRGEFDDSLKAFLDAHYDYQKDSGIHYQTLKKFLNDLKSEGRELPGKEILNVEFFNKATIKE